MDAKRPCEIAKRRLLGLVINMGGRKYRCLPLSQSRGGVHYVGIVGEWLGGVGGQLAAMLGLITLLSASRGPPCCLFRTVWSACVFQKIQPYVRSGSLCPPALGHCWLPGLMCYPRIPSGL